MSANCELTLAVKRTAYTANSIEQGELQRDGTFGEMSYKYTALIFCNADLE